MKHVLFLAPVGGVGNGADISANHQMAHLRALGYRVSLVARVPLDLPYQHFLAEHGITAYVIPYTWWRDEFLANEQNARECNQAIGTLIELIKSDQVDLAVTNTANMPWLAAAAAACVIPHLWLIHEFPEGDFAYTRDRYDFIAGFSNEVLAASEVLAAVIRPLCGETPVSHFLPFADVDRLSLSAAPAGRRLVSVNHVSTRKNTLDLIRIFERLQPRNPGLRLAITGEVIEPEYFRELQRYLADRKLTGVSFAEPGKGNWEQVSAHDVFVNTSDLETFSLTMVEALKLGVPMVAADNHASTAMLARGYLNPAEVYRKGDLAEAAAKVQAILDEPAAAGVAAATRAVRVRQEQSLSQVTSPLVDAIERSRGSRRPELRHLAPALRAASLRAPAL